ncbi:MAG TPA: DUF4062 domain-containing protein, partial [Symbiobacteriaceae bacterium]|nr:DUF4062 domain-containing protein [Symbiobacteriaceae bacterium]
MSAPTHWPTVRIFVSSTFADMHAERDYLTDVVFPELRERCARRRLHLVDVDLRWGVTEEEAEGGKALTICLEEIDQCRPFFICLLGERYGWVPDRQQLPSGRRFRWIRHGRPGRSVTALEVFHAVLRNRELADQSFFYFRDPALLAELPPQMLPVFETADPVHRRRLKGLKTAIRRSGRLAVDSYPCRYAGLDVLGRVRLEGLELLGRRILEDLWTAICDCYPDTSSDAEVDERLARRYHHDLFIETQVQRFEGREPLLADLRRRVDAGSARPLVVVGEPGSGKSALLARFARLLAEERPEMRVIAHFVGAGPGSTDVLQLLRRLCLELGEQSDDATIPGDYNGLTAALAERLAGVGSEHEGGVVLILDGLNQLDADHRAHTLSWLPRLLPPGVRVVISTLPGDCLDALRIRQPAPDELRVGPLTRQEVQRVVRRSLAVFGKKLDEKAQLPLLMAKPGAMSPLYLRVACEELRVSGAFESLTNQIAALPRKSAGLFGALLRRLEGEHGVGLVKDALTALACARHGLTEAELLGVLTDAAGAPVPRFRWLTLYRQLLPYLRPVGQDGTGILDFFHGELAR